MKSSEKKKKFLSVLILFYSGRNVKLLKRPFKKKLKPNLSKTLQVLVMVAIVSEMTVIQFQLAAHFIPLVHLLISKYTMHTLSPERDLCSSDLWTLKHTVIVRFHQYMKTESLLLNFIF